MSKIFVDEIAGIADANTVVIPGHVIQVVNNNTSTSTVTSSGSFVDTTLTATITPTSNSSKILVIVQQNGIGKLPGATSTYVNLQLVRDATVLIEFGYPAGYTNSSQWNGIGTCGCSHEDSPNTTSAVVYKTQIQSSVAGQNVYAQWSNGLANSQITLMEIAG